MKRYLRRIEVLSIIFLILITIFSISYSFYMEPIDSIYCALSFHTFTGTNMIEKKKELKIIACVQMIITYILIGLIVYSVLF